MQVDVTMLDFNNEDVDILIQNGKLWVNVNGLCRLRVQNTNKNKKLVHRDERSLMHLFNDLSDVIPDQFKVFPFNLLDRIAAGDGGEMEDFADFDSELVKEAFVWFEENK